MTRQLDIEREQREETRRLELIKAVEYGIVGALQHQGIELLGLSLMTEEFNTRCVVKARAEERRIVAFVSSDSISNVLIQVYRLANNQALQWGADKYHPSGD